jgi:hypothetical protein
MSNTLATVAPVIQAVASAQQVSQTNQGMLALVTALLGLAVPMLALLLRNSFQNRKLTVDNEARLQEMALAAAGKLNEGLLAEIVGLRSEVVGLREENTSLRGEVRQLHGIIDGMRREQQAEAISAGRLVADSFGSREIRGAAERAQRALDDRGT